jgi:hypothetical protein
MPQKCLPSLPSIALGIERRTLGAEELAGDVEGLAAHNNDLLAVEQLLSDGAGEATEQVALAVDDLIHKSARGSSAMLRCVEIERWQCGRRLPVCEGAGSCFREVRTMTGSKVDMVSIPGGCAGGLVVVVRGPQNLKCGAHSERSDKAALGLKVTSVGMPGPTKPPKRTEWTLDLNSFSHAQLFRNNHMQQRPFVCYAGCLLHALANGFLRWLTTYAFPAHQRRPIILSVYYHRKSR